MTPSDSREPAQRSAIVTGAARGIGLAIGARLAADGMLIALWDRDAGQLEEAAQALSAQGATVLAVPVDITDRAHVDRALAQSMEALGQPSVLVNNAAILGRSGPTLDASLDEWKRVFDVNVFGALQCAQAVVPGMVRRGYGRVVNVASIAGKEGNPFAAAYAASKAALISMTKSLGKELAETGVLVNCITPSAADTDIFAVYDQSQRAQLEARLLERVPMKRFVRVEEVAEMAAWLCSVRCSFSTGAVFDISGGRAMY
ncbi:Short-chain dehydrogenase/reductase sdr [Cupriavidus taiwanensis]|uniref:2-dehydro-3-deoxy-L-rhamnonate dehydrogenase (NAD(+)) n=1 Tax=Cupriavidus taiwanensis TaxID=164546 RepID=A0A976FZ95_9BURK|nr:SDR family NAD(P)-dependent oxidoreductase [Cupriavidus taiwanensis]SOY97470.1 Short-chain dehydrogenase/reductase sdr [Cupriavidus taiwanensis]SOZ00200.1 Short-chain dehydrogenase/reductase sdr [Cupriavidus taiwanensis]SPD68128.1 2-dehydro-3-deoxy-L-rhamnonate dehydrogenase (NAD(+)) [Cupriavidus taiwanensis]